ncbi:hypothetical protein [Bacillus infantis]|uniref:hypothetical protein n=1 Tax=Bacillus infantis TaxID=324767 RepID=UPI003CF1204C
MKSALEAKGNGAKVDKSETQGQAALSRKGWIIHSLRTIKEKPWEMPWQLI